MNEKQCFDLSSLEWSVAGYMPSSWTGRSMELGFGLEPEVPPLPAQVPGSVQGALRAAGLLPDWFEGLHSLACEWVEHCDWMFSARLPDEWFAAGRRFVLNCGGLDGNGVVIFNKKPVGTFANSFIPYDFDLSEHVRSSGNELHLVFFLPPRWLGQVGYTSRMKDWKPRFNYGWDWLPRLVQIGPWEPLILSVSEGPELAALRCRCEWDLGTGTGTLWARGELAGPEAGACRIHLALDDGTTVIRAAVLSPAEFASGVTWTGLPVAAWWPNGAGPQPLYRLRCELLDAAGQRCDAASRRLGFKHVAWRPCAQAPAGADPWLCVVNGRPLFLQGVDWTPISPTFADLAPERYRHLVELYRELGCNVFRVWGGAFLEKDCFYDLCDELGLLVWQEFPLCSAGHENWPHEDEPSMDTLVAIAGSYIARRQHRVSLLMWCGGNELQGNLEGEKTGIGRPVTLAHPLMQRWQALVEREDPGRRFVPTSASGPRFMAHAKDFGQGLHWDVHGPWTPPGATPAEWSAYWQADDALFRSETGAPGASPADLIRRYSGGLPVLPATLGNPLWRRFSWWLEWSTCLKELGREPATLEEYVAWSQARQAAALALAARACKERFPAIGGIIFWMGHDAFPCGANTSIVDFHGRPKPAALAIAAVFRETGRPAPPKGTTDDRQSAAHAAG